MESISQLFDLAKQVKAKRLEQGLTQTQLAQKAEVSRRWLIGFEQGDLEDARLSTILKTLNALGMTLRTDEAAVQRAEKKPIASEEILRLTGQGGKISDALLSQIGNASADVLERLREQNRQTLQQLQERLNASVNIDPRFLDKRKTR